MKLFNLPVILRVISTILLIEVVSFFACIPIALFYKEDALPFIYSCLVIFLPAAILYLIFHKSDLSNASTRDTYLSVTLSWLLVSLAGSLPYIFSGTCSFINSCFESTSGFSTTGASALADVEVLPHSILFWRSLTQWIGGLGIIVMVVLIFPSLKVTGYRLFTLESSLMEKISPRASSIAFRLLMIYLTLSISEIILLTAGDMNLFDAVCHSFATVATGGFSTKNTSLVNFSSYSQYVIMIFMFLAGTSSVVYYYAVKMNFKKIKQNDELWFYIAVVLIAGTLSSVILITKGFKLPEPAFREGFFQTISIITCTGFTSADYLLWPQAGIMLIFLLMLSGGCTGSTSGGIKMARHLIALKSFKNVFIKLTHPSSVTMVRFNGKAITENTIGSILSFIMLYLFIFFAATLLLTITGNDIPTSASATATCLAGIGPGIGTVGPMSNYFHLNGISKLILCFVMILGRLEILTVFVVFSKSFWKK
ncbi:MAG TPA: TrkH family potassium uptake protein [Bacteroidales bacterium]|nr:TrkH family potassium uptake protein [Bacteroidales bacterium]HOU95316.1 TrkH family potassium uptake protein [Bacteroidales bacterium]HQG35652.1 TrkH family potassium uptake protein [Bacteroidales bacterium]HQG51962.1 TrkH family potassium uptake protein [Bacteroidales bacterium]HQJ19658.1 TrkH family potassium uptake protein [Bacteroidales bacterium]